MVFSYLPTVAAPAGLGQTSITPVKVTSLPAGVRDGCFGLMQTGCEIQGTVFDDAPVFFM